MDNKDKKKTVLEIENLSYTYPQHSKKTLDNISFSLLESTLCGLLGPNGSGKSTLFRVCMQFIQAQEGNIKINGQNISLLKPAQIAKYIAYVPQEHKQPFPFTVEDMVLMGRTSRMKSFLIPQNKDKEKAYSSMERVGISHLSKQAFNQLSGGQRQLVLIARALTQECPLMILDEPSSALDFSNQVVLWKLLKELVKENKTILVCSHDPNHILWFCDEVIALSHGRIQIHSHPHELLEKNILKEIFNVAFKSVQIENSYFVYPYE